MARQNKTRFALLGLLALQPMSGYDVKQVSETCLSNFWNESYGQIYPSLNALLTEGAVVKSVDTVDGKPDRFIYTTTECGIEEVKEWLAKPDEPFKVRHETLLKVFFGDIAGSELTADRLKTYRVKLQQQLDEYHAIEQRLSQCSTRSKPDYGRYTLRSGILTTTSLIEWCDETLTDLEKLDDTNENEAKQ